MFPCQSCGNPASQVQAAVSALKGSTYGHFWLDIEGPGQYWSSNQQTNQQFFEGLVSAAKSAGVNIGVYSSASQWVPIFGSSYNGGSAYPLWYANYDGAENFNDFKPFGGWSKPSLKQYGDNGNTCGVSYDKDWSPSGLFIRN
jgi:GH25 family lysozyme M1 (1,4-beta-N-acetylmuramidase)